MSDLRGTYPNPVNELSARLKCMERLVFFLVFAFMLRTLAR